MFHIVMLRAISYSSNDIFINIKNYNDSLDSFRPSTKSYPLSNEVLNNKL